MKRIPVLAIALAAATMPSLPAAAQNLSIVTQKGYGNAQLTMQQHRDNLSTTMQSGNGNHALTMQQGDATAATIQMGSGNSATAVQSGSHTYSVIVQSGDGHEQTHVMPNDNTAMGSLQVDAVHPGYSSQMSGGVAGGGVHLNFEVK